MRTLKFSTRKELTMAVAYGYISGTAAGGKLKIIEDSIKNYCRIHDMKLSGITCEENENPSPHSPLLKNLVGKLKKGMALIVFDAPHLGESIVDLIDFLEPISAAGASLHFVKYRQNFQPKDLVDTIQFLETLVNVEQDFVSQRTLEAIEQRQNEGSKLGRPKGRKNKSRKLDKFRPEIKKYLSLNISKASIAKLLGCHAQTLYNYLDDNDLSVESEGEEEASSSL